ncbi:hypothetical protein I7I51_00509 [Histoplasma capsulatum]|uniref:MPN domain-containing protein n=1 Tax=Ajellomyces capsulatus TaxID=5037 RepID=A0A8A1MBV0_AJECA|nr:hypothetical protein I7I51_00509 [Histoplasma capsulatum]
MHPQKRGAFPLAKTTPSLIRTAALPARLYVRLAYKMLRHGRAGVPMEVMGLMLGDFVNEFTVRVVDVFAMPQSDTGVSVEAVDPVFQTKMMEMLLLSVVREVFNPIMKAF